MVVESALDWSSSLISMSSGTRRTGWLGCTGSFFFFLMTRERLLGVGREG